MSGCRHAGGLKQHLHGTHQIGCQIGSAFGLNGQNLAAFSTNSLN